jgi:hypothetical protein
MIRRLKRATKRRHRPALLVTVIVALTGSTITVDTMRRGVAISRRLLTLSFARD